LQHNLVISKLKPMKDFSHIKEYTGCNPASPYERAGILDYLKKIGVPIYHLTPGNANSFPGLCWAMGVVCGAEQYSDIIKTRLSTSEFVALFEAPALPKIGDWQPTIIVDRNTLKVGCTEIPFSTVEAIYKAMR
jgi:hypothetical protein